MPYIAGTAVPAAVTDTCPRCKALRTFVNNGANVLRCGGCDWPFSFGAGSSPLSTSANVSAGGEALTFASGGTQFAKGDVLHVADGASSETVLVTGTTTGTSVPVTALAYAHTSGKAVTVAALTPELAQDEVPPAPGWGF